jgi:hypothetical protein
VTLDPELAAELALVTDTIKTVPAAYAEMRAWWAQHGYPHVTGLDDDQAGLVLAKGYALCGRHGVTLAPMYSATNPRRPFEETSHD